MADVRLYAVTAEGAQELHLAPPPANLYDLPPGLALGVYTAFRTFDHYKFLQLSDHLHRLSHSMALLSWRYELDEAALRQALHQVCVGYDHPDARVRIDVLAQAATVLGSESRVLLTLAPFVPQPPAVYEEGVHLALARRLQRREPQAKTADFVLQRQNYPVGAPETYDFLLLDEQERLLEGSTSNFYAVRDGAVLTAGDGVLEGITRKIVLQLVRAQGIPLSLRAPTLAEAPQLDEAFLSSSSRGLIPVRSIDGQAVRSAPGPITRRLMAAYAQFVAQNVQPALAPDDTDAL